MANYIELYVESIASTCTTLESCMSPFFCNGTYSLYSAQKYSLGTRAGMTVVARHVQGSSLIKLDHEAEARLAA